MILLLVACLAFEAPPDSVRPIACAECDASAACDLFTDECVPNCRVDDECADNRICADGLCELPCDFRDCEEGYRCDDFTNRCLTSCGSDDDCRSDWECCLEGDCEAFTCVQ